jgi:hypothetical protein
MRPFRYERNEAIQLRKPLQRERNPLAYPLSPSSNRASE